MSVSQRHLAILKGGPSAEHEVSLRTGAAVAAALRHLGHHVEEILVKETDFEVPTGVEAAFICLHGTFGEDGGAQELLESRGIPYTGCGIEASRMAFDKEKSKAAFIKAGVATPPGQIWWAGQKVHVPLPLVIKPTTQGSSVGVQFVHAPDQLEAALNESLKYGQTLIIERMVQGRELTVGILGDLALPIVEIRPKTGWYDYSTKYTSGKTDYLCPAPLDEGKTQQVQRIALAAHQSLGCSVYSRVDILLDQQLDPWVLEVNTIPGMTETSLLPKAAAAAGLSFAELCTQILELSLLERGGIKS